jgi:hypothetical protein
MKRVLLLLSVAYLFTACNASRTSPTPPTVYKFDALLKDQLEPQGLEADFKAYGLKQEGRSSRSQNRWLLTYDINSISGPDLLEKLKAHPDVVEVQMYPVDN